MRKIIPFIKPKPELFTITFFKSELKLKSEPELFTIPFIKSEPELFTIPFIKSEPKLKSEPELFISVCRRRARAEQRVCRLSRTDGKWGGRQRSRCRYGL